MGRILVIGDIHGGLKGLQNLFLKVPKADKLIFLGDYVDGWSDSPGIIDFLISLANERMCIFLRGNHDALLLEYLLTGNKNELWQKSGGLSTIRGYDGVSQETKNRHIKFLEELSDYYIDNSNRLFVHAGFSNLKGVTFEHFPQTFYWDRTLWELVLALDRELEVSSPHYPKRLLHYSEIFIGHSPVGKGPDTLPQKKATIWNVDTGAAYLGPITAMDVDTYEIFQSDPVYLFYPGETGRNE